MSWCCTYCQGTQGFQGLLSTWSFPNYHKNQRKAGGTPGAVPSILEMLLENLFVEQLTPTSMSFIPNDFPYTHVSWQKCCCGSFSFPPDYYFSLFSLLLRTQHDLFSVKQAMLQSRQIERAGLGRDIKIHFVWKWKIISSFLADLMSFRAVLWE